MICNEANLPIIADGLHLCYAVMNKCDFGGWAYFATCAPKGVDFDGWNRVPYEHNSRMLPWHPSCSSEPYALVRVAWDGPFITPNYGTLNSDLSVQMIQAGAAPWLRTASWYYGEPVALAAGAKLKEVSAAITEAGGWVYMDRETIQVLGRCP